MKLIKLLDLANEGYDDGYLSFYYHPCSGAFDEAGSGDTLAEFIVRELTSTFVDEMPDAEQLAEAKRLMEQARDDIVGVIVALEAVEGRLQACPHVECPSWGQIEPGLEACEWNYPDCLMNPENWPENMIGIDTPTTRAFLCQYGCDHGEADETERRLLSG